MRSPNLTFVKLVVRGERKLSEKNGFLFAEITGIAVGSRCFAVRNSILILQGKSLQGVYGDTYYILQSHQEQNENL